MIIVLFIETDQVDVNLRDCQDKMQEMLMKMQDFFKEEKIDEQMKNDWRYENIEQQEGEIKKRVIISE